MRCACPTPTMVRSWCRRGATSTPSTPEREQQSSVVARLADGVPRSRRRCARGVGRVPHRRPELRRACATSRARCRAFAQRVLRTAGSSSARAAVRATTACCGAATTAGAIDLAGAVREITSQRGFGGIARESFDLRPLHVDTWGGLVFVNPSPGEVEDLRSFLDVLPAELDPFAWASARARSAARSPCPATGRSPSTPSTRCTTCRVCTRSSCRSWTTCTPPIARSRTGTR